VTVTTYAPEDVSALGDAQNSITNPQNRAELKFQKMLVEWTNQQYNKMKSARTRVELDWYVNLAFFFGKQNVVPLSNYVAAQSTRLFIPPAPYYRVRLVINKIRPTIMKELAKLTSQRPTVSVIPSSTEDKDIMAAQAGDQIWDALYRRRDFATVLERALWWSSITGTGYIKCYWDEKAIDVDSDSMGDIVYVQETPFHILVPDLREVELENQPWLIHVQTRSKEFIESRYKDVLTRPVNYNVSAANDILDDSFINLMGADQKVDSCLVKEVWIKPESLPMFPNGGMFTIVGDQIVQGFQQWPYSHGMYPFTKITSRPSGKYYGDSVITDLIPVQREINRTHSQIVEAKNKMAKPQLIGIKGSVDVAKITSEPGLFIEVEAGYQLPTPIPLSQLPAYVQEELERLYRDYDDISGQHEVSKGATPPGVTAGTAIAYLQEQDDTTLALYFGSMEKGVEKTAKMSLNYVQQYWSYPRTVKIVGTDGTFDAKVFRGADLRSNADVKVESGSALPTSKAAKQAFIMDIMKMGWVDPDDGLEMLEIGALNKIYERAKMDAREAQRENLMMASVTEDDISMHDELHQDGSIIIPVNSWNNDAVHIRKHDDFRKSQAFMSLPEVNRALFESHVQAHKINMQMKLIDQPIVPGEIAYSPEAQGQQQIMGQQLPDNSAQPPEMGSETMPGQEGATGGSPT